MNEDSYSELDLIARWGKVVKRRKWGRGKSLY
jgi:hypothetical protein